MTNIKENKKYTKYFILEKVEFLEFLARMADRRFPSEMELAEKIKNLFELLFPPLLKK
jgi:hypothetical protein